MTDRFVERALTIVQAVGQLGDVLRVGREWLQEEVGYTAFARDVESLEVDVRAAREAFLDVIEGRKRPHAVPIAPTQLRERLAQRAVGYSGGPLDGQPAGFLPGLPNLEVPGDATGFYELDREAWVYRWRTR